MEKVALVSTAEAFPKVTVPGPESLLQVVVTVPGGLGSPSSVTVPLREAEDGSVTGGTVPASTMGGRLGTGLTVIVTVSLALRAPSLAVSRST